EGRELDGVEVVQRLGFREVGRELAPGLLVPPPAGAGETDLPVQVRDQLRSGGELARLLLLDRLRRVREPRLAAARLYSTLHRRLRLFAPHRERVDEQETEAR